MSVEKRIVLKIGGSVMYDENLNINFNLLNKVKNWYYRNKSEYSKIVMVVGGGNLSRELQKKVSGNIDNESNLHNIAMTVTQTSAALLQAFINDPNIYIPKKIGDAYEFLWEEGTQTLVSGGLRVGWSTDMDASVFADILSVNRVLKISDIDYLYDKDPKINPDSKIIKDISWNQYFKLFSISEEDNHTANMNIPIDKECSKFSAKKNISFFICGGINLKNKEYLEDILSEGTLLHP